MDIGWVKTEKHLTVVYNGVPTALSIGTGKYAAAMRLIKKGDKEGLIRLVTENPIKSNKIKVVKGKVVDKKGQEVPPVLIGKLLTFIDKKLPVGPYVKFLENIKLNPDQRSREQLFDYLKTNNYPITKDGCFIAYKYVKKDENGKLVDNYSGTYDNSVGKVVAMDRSNCNPDPYQTCSRGLHVAAFEYASGGGDVLLEVKVNPKDVVSVPIDYNRQKIRVCRYEVLRAGASEIKEHYMKIKDSSPEIKVSEDINFETMSGKEIIDHVLEKTGIRILVSPKSKKSVIRHAMKALEANQKVVTMDDVDLSVMSGAQIIEYVRSQTGVQIEFSPKSKKSVIKKAWEILTSHGIKVK